MTHHGPILPAAPLDGVSFTAAPPPRSGDRWTPAKMADFLRQLSATHSVSAAAKSVGMSRQSAYRLRSRLKDKPFDLAWDVAFHHSYDNLAHAALERALNGVEVPVFFAGEQVGSYRKFDERLTVALLAMSTQRGHVPVIGRHAAEAERHAPRFEALLAEVAAGGGEEEVDLAAQPDPPGEVFRLHSINPSPMSEAEFLAELGAFEEDDGG
jgi:hypothetical protein